MSGVEEVKFSMKVLVNKEDSKVLFAEVDHDLADILISFLTLPLGTIVRLLVKHYGDDVPVIGSLTTLYKGLTDLDRSNFCTNLGKQMLIKPKNPFEDHLAKLKINIDDTELTKYFTCDLWSCVRNKDPVSVRTSCNTYKCACGRVINKEIELLSIDSKQVGVFTRDTASFIISDDLHMVSNLIGSGLQILNNLGINGMDRIEEKTVLVGLEEIMALLKGSLFSRTPLTDLMFHRTQTVSNTVNFGPGNVIGQSSTTSTSKNMTVKIIVQKSTGKVLLAQTREDFVDFVFSMLTIPLGGALSILGGDFVTGSIHNLHRSFTSLSADWYVETQNPFNTTQVPPKYLSKHQIFPLTEQTLYCLSSLNARDLRYHLSYDNKSYYLVNEKIHSIDLPDPKGKGSYVKGPAMFTVSDDLVVTQTSAISSFSILNRLRVPLSDIEEYVVDIGIEEALSILKASLSSTSALNNGLQPFLKRHFKKPKLEN